MQAPPTTDPLYDASHPDKSTKYPAAYNRRLFIYIRNEPEDVKRKPNGLPKERS